MRIGVAFGISSTARAGYMQCSAFAPELLPDSVAAWLDQFPPSLFVGALVAAQVRTVRLAPMPSLLSSRELSDRLPSFQNYLQAIDDVGESVDARAGLKTGEFSGAIYLASGWDAPFAARLEILPALSQCKRVKLAGLVSGDPDKARRVASMHGVPTNSIYDYRGFDAIKNDLAIHAVYIVLPNSMHAEYAIRAARAGKHVLCEKPMATSVEEAERMTRECEIAKRKLMIAYRIQYKPLNREAMKRVRAAGKDFGPLRLLQMQNCQNQSKSNLNQWRLKRSLAGGGSLPDIGLYCLNTARFLTGEEPVEVGAHLQSAPGDRRFAEVEDTVAWWMRFPNGALAQCLCSYGAADSKTYRAMGENGWIELSPAFNYSGLRMRAGHGTSIEEINPAPSNQFALEMDHFAECVANDRKPYTPGEEGVQDHRVMAAIYQAASSGRPVALEKFTKKDAFRGPPPA